LVSVWTKCCLIDYYIYTSLESNDIIKEPCMIDFDDVINLGKSLIKDEITLDRFINYKQKVKTLGVSLKNKALSENKSILPAIEDLINLDEESYKVNIITRFFHFKKYQYKYSVNPWTNKHEHIQLRYVIETNEILENLIETKSI